jgi:hypothetical protein
LPEGSEFPIYNFKFYAHFSPGTMQDKLYVSLVASALDDLDDVGLVWGASLLVLHFVELPQTFFDSHFQIARDTFSFSIVFVILLEFSILVFQFFDLFLLDADHDIFFLEIFLKEDVIDFVALLHHHEVVVGMRELADVVLELH